MATEQSGKCVHCLGSFHQNRRLSQDAPGWESYHYAYMPEQRVFPYANMSRDFFKESTAPTKLLSFLSLDFRPEGALVGRWTRPLNRKCAHYTGFCAGEYEVQESRDTWRADGSPPLDASFVNPSGDEQNLFATM